METDQVGIKGGAGCDIRPWCDSWANRLPRPAQFCPYGEQRCPYTRSFTTCCCAACRQSSFEVNQMDHRGCPFVARTTVVLSSGSAAHDGSHVVLVGWMLDPRELLLSMSVALRGGSGTMLERPPLGFMVTLQATGLQLHRHYHLAFNGKVLDVGVSGGSLASGAKVAVPLGALLSP